MKIKLVNDTAGNVEVGTRVILGSYKISNDRWWTKTGYDLFGRVILRDKYNREITREKENAVCRNPNLLEQMETGLI